MTIKKDGIREEDFHCWNPVDQSFYLTELVTVDGDVLGWELSNADEYLSGADFAFKDFEEPTALMIDPVYAPEGATLKDLMRRIHERSKSPALSAGIGP